LIYDSDGAFRPAAHAGSSAAAVVTRTEVGSQLKWGHAKLTLKRRSISRHGDRLTAFCKIVVELAGIDSGPASAPPRHREGHHVRKGSRGIERAANDDPQRPVVHSFLK